MPNYQGIWRLSEQYQGASGWPTPPETILIAGGQTASLTYTNAIDKIAVGSTGNATDFGDLTVTRSGSMPAGNSTRGIWAGGGITGSRFNTIDFVTYTSAGNAADFGDMTIATSSFGGSQVGSSTRSLIIAGYQTTTTTNVIEYINPSSAGNATDYGDLSYTSTLGNTASCSSSTRGLVAGGYNGSIYLNTIHYMTIATTGNTTDFGDLTLDLYQARGVSNNTIGIFGYGVQLSGTRPTTIQYVNIASTGNGTDFGDLLSVSVAGASAATSTKGIFAGGRTGGSFDPRTNTVQVLTIATTGNASDFGDLSSELSSLSAAGAGMAAVQ